MTDQELLALLMNEGRANPGRDNMTDEQLQAGAAIDTIARAVYQSMTALDPGDVSEEWVEHPLIGEHDWELVVDRVIEIANEGTITTAEYDAAYAVLAGRAAESERGDAR